MSSEREQDTDTEFLDSDDVAEAEEYGGVMGMLDRLRGDGLRYKLGAELGKGGHGMVTVAYDSFLGRRVALKRLRKGRESRTRDIARFLEEVQITGQIEHPNIVPVHDLGVIDGEEVFFTMKLVEGRNLEVVLKALKKGSLEARRKYTLFRLLRILQDVCQAVAFAHSRGVIHRDLKPSNIMLGDYGEVQVMDWGLAKLLPEGGEFLVEQASVADVSVTDDSEESFRQVRFSGHGGAVVTQVGTVKGTPAYMSPEQARGLVEKVGIRSDVYSLGVILFEILTLRRPFSGKDPRKVVRAVAFDPIVPPRKRAPHRNIPQELDDLAVRCLSKEPEERPESAHRLYQEIEIFLEGTKRREEAEIRVHQGVEQASRYEEQQASVRAMQRRVRKLRSQIKPWDLIEKKRELWASEEELSQAEVGAIDTFGAAVTAYGQALGHDPENREARLGLAALYWNKFRDAEARRDVKDQHSYLSLVEQYDDGTYATFLRGNGWLHLETSPPAAEAVLSRLQEKDRELQPVAPVKLGRTPRMQIEVAMGSYHLELTKPGYRTARIPVQVERNDQTRVHVHLLPEGTLSEEYVHVPAGMFWMGGDPSAVGSLPRQQVFAGDYAIARRPVTMAEYLVFVNELAQRDPVLAHFHAPRDAAEEKSYFALQPGGEFVLTQWFRGAGVRVTPDLPVFGVSWEAARAYCEWLSEREGVIYRLPSEAEWEKAARGVDGRFFPWGDSGDGGFCKCAESRQGRPTPEPSDNFAETDRSPYGVEAMGGGVSEWCDGWWDDAMTLRPVRGGSWVQPAQHARVCARVGQLAREVFAHIGFRVVREIDPSHLPDVRSPQGQTQPRLS